MFILQNNMSTQLKRLLRVELTKEIFTISIVSFISAIGWAGSTFISRAIIVDLLNINDVGIFQAAWNLIIIPTNFVLSIFSFYTYPKIIISGKIERKQIINESISLCSLIIPFITILLIISKDFIIPFLYRDDFSEAVKLIPFFGIGALFFLIWWVLGAPLLPEKRIKHYLLFNLLGAFAYPIAAYIFIPKLGLIGIGLAYLLSNILMFLILIGDTYKNSKVSIDDSNKTLGTISIMVIVFISCNIIKQELWSVLINGSLFTLWLFFSIRVSEVNLQWQSSAREFLRYIMHFIWRK